MSTILTADRQFVWHPFTRQPALPEPLVIVRGKGSWLFDEGEKAYLDAISSWWVTVHGHAHPKIAEALFQQAQTLEQVIFAGFTHGPAALLAEELIGILPGPMARIFYSDNGSTATEVAIKMAIQYWWNQSGNVTSGNIPRKKLLALRNSYHGDTFGAMGVSERSVFTSPFQSYLNDTIFLPTPSPETLSESLQILEEFGQEIVAFIYEPLVQGAGGMVMYDAAVMNTLLKKCREMGIICIADEVMTGFGRTGTLFASEQLAYPPDIICLSKALTGGTMALGATACSEKIYAAYCGQDPLKTFFHGHSFTANPLACTAARTSLQLIFEENTKQKIDFLVEKTKSFYSKLLPWQQKGCIKNLRFRGTILAFELTSSGADGYLNEAGATFNQMSMKLGVYLRPLGNTVYTMPPYCFTEEEFALMESAIDSVLTQLYGTAGEKI